MPSRCTTAAAAFLFLASCGGGEDEPPQAANQTADESLAKIDATTQARRAIRQRQELADEAIDLVGKYGDAILSITDLRSAKMAAIDIELLEIQVQELGDRMEAAGPPPPSQVDAFRAALRKASEAQGDRISAAAATIAQDAQINERIALASNKFGTSFERQIFKDYGLDGK